MEQVMQTINQKLTRDSYALIRKLCVENPEIRNFIDSNQEAQKLFELPEEESSFDMYLQFLNNFSLNNEQFQVKSLDCLLRNFQKLIINLKLVRLTIITLNNCTQNFSLLIKLFQFNCINLLFDQIFQFWNQDSYPDFQEWVLILINKLIQFDFTELINVLKTSANFNLYNFLKLLDTYLQGKFEKKTFLLNDKSQEIQMHYVHVRTLIDKCQAYSAQDQDYELLYELISTLAQEPNLRSYIVQETNFLTYTLNITLQLQQNQKMEDIKSYHLRLLANLAHKNELAQKTILESGLQVLKLVKSIDIKREWSGFLIRNLSDHSDFHNYKLQ